MVLKLVVIASIFLFLSACGGGGGGAPAAIAPVVVPPQINGREIPDVSSFDAASFESPDYYEAFCENPRSGTTDLQGSLLTENYWLRSWTQLFYLWYGEVDYQNPELFDDKLDYFDVLKTNGLTPSGAPLDKFHFTFDTEEWEQLSQSGVSTGYGMSFITLNASLPRQVYIRYVQPGSPAFNAGIRRGSRIIEVDGADLLNGNTQTDFNAFNAGLFPASSGESHAFVMLHPGDASNSSFSMSSANVVSSPVLAQEVITTASGKVGYLMFNDHIATAEEQLVDAFTDFQAEGLSDLVLDLRYNGGGFLAISSQLAYMITGTADTTGKTFESQVFNDQHQVLNPFSGQTLEPLPFLDETIGFSLTAGQALPSLGLRKVYILTGSGTCSASESVINSLRGINVEVVQIGTTTCGKPYGFYPTDNCGTTYFSIHFRGENDIGFGDYAAGFSPANTNGLVGELVTGCAVLDDLGNPFGDINEALFATALQHRLTMTCPAPPVATIFAVEGLSLNVIERNNLQQSFALDNKVLGMPK
ncbi:MAG: S41 family peptidase [Gammaproteobacteria bacterium]|nr:S41 family peptidase [Gammaproteobacteria bacterium]